MSDKDWLLVPMEVSALAVGNDADAEQHTWSDLAPDYSKIIGRRSKKLVGPDLVNLFSQGSSAALGKGIHLHWFLPEAFGHGVENSKGAITFPHIPNRWLIRRVRYPLEIESHGNDRRTNSTCDIKDIAAWVVESDYLHPTTGENEQNGEDGTVSIPCHDRPRLYASVGRVTLLQDWTESDPEYRFELTALGSGSPDFAAQYPACKSVLGFHDPQPSGDDAGDWHVSYLVTGWCSVPKQDLLHGVTADNWQKKLEEQQWSLSSKDLPAPVPTRVLCHGAVSRIEWNRGRTHQSPVPNSKATVCVGNTSAEALATLLAHEKQSGGTASLPEPLLAAFQYDMLGSSQHLGDVHAEFHRHRFTSSPGGDRYTIDAKRKPVGAGAPVAPEAVEPPSFVQQLPADIESALYKLNAKARDAARQQRESESLRQALFTTWCLWANGYAATYEEPAALTPELKRGRAAVTTGARAVQAAQSDHEEARKTLEGTLAARLPDLELACSTEPPFYRAADPAVLIAGKNFGPSGLPLRNVGDDDLPCRQSSEIVAGISANILNTGDPIMVTAKELFPLLKELPSLPSLKGGPSSVLVDELLAELLVLDPVDPQQDPPAPPLAKTVKAELLKRCKVGLSQEQLGHLDGIPNFLAKPVADNSKLKFSNQKSAVPSLRPDAVALFRWTRNPWRPLILVWEVNWYPDHGQDGEGDLPGSWEPWSLDDDGNEFRLPSPATFPAKKPVTYKSYTMLAPHAKWVLRRRLESLRKRTNYDVDAVISKIDSLEVLSQSLSGFHDALRQLRHGLQLPPINPAYVTADDPASVDATKIPKLDTVAKLVDPQHMHAPDEDAAFLPIRAGHVELSSLSLVDSFGQTRKLIDGNPDQYKLFSSFGLPGPSRVTAPVTEPSSPLLIPLPPRYAQPARLDFRWLSADADHPGGSPLCGWIFPNYLDKSQMICDAAGKLWGALQMIIRTTLAGGTGGTRSHSSKAFFWVPVPGTEATPTDIPDPRLRSLVRNLLALGADAGREFLKSLAAAQEDSGTAPEHDPRLSILIGKPLALARASLQIELMGLPLRHVQAAIPPAKNGSHAGTAPDEATRGFTRLRFPIRLGGPAQRQGQDSVKGLAGGLAGYFVDGEDGVFYPRYGLTGLDFSGSLEHSHELSLDAERAVELTLLLDPVAPVHARCGLLPRTSLQLPEPVVASVSSIRDVFFQSAPMVGPPGGPRVPRPSDDYGQWSWAVRPRVTYWQEYAEITDPGDRGGFGQSPLEIQEGWLKLAMNPVSIAAFWVKEGAVTVPAETRVTLGWMVDGAETLTLSVKDKGQDADHPLESWTKRPGSGLPEEYRLVVNKSIKVTLTATDQRGNRSTKSLQLKMT